MRFWLMGGGYCDILIECKAINNLLEKYKIFHFDYASIDTEGAEFQIIKNINLDKIDVSIFSVENNDGDIRIRDYLRQKGYTCIRGIQDDFFLKKKNLRYFLLKYYIFSLKIWNKLIFELSKLSKLISIKKI